MRQNPPARAASALGSDFEKPRLHRVPRQTPHDSGGGAAGLCRWGAGGAVAEGAAGAGGGENKKLINRLTFPVNRVILGICSGFTRFKFF
jgi:hypothetical protein